MPTPRTYDVPTAPGRPAVRFRVSAGGRYDRWDPRTKSWAHVTDPAGREYLSRAVESGDAVPTR